MTPHFLKHAKPKELFRYGKQLLAAGLMLLILTVTLVPALRMALAEDDMPEAENPPVATAEETVEAVAEPEEPAPVPEENPTPEETTVPVEASPEPVIGPMPLELSDDKGDAKPVENQEGSASAEANATPKPVETLQPVATVEATVEPVATPEPVVTPEPTVAPIPTPTAAPIPTPTAAPVQEPQQVEPAEPTPEPTPVSDPTADVESREDWDNMMAFMEYGEYNRETLLSAAESQVGYEESERNFIWDEEGNMHGYTRYGAALWDPYMEWCAAFVTFCLDYAHIPEEILPRSVNVGRWAKMAQEEGLYYEKGEYEPQPGDLVFFQDEEGNPCHIGIITEYEPAEYGVDEYGNEYLAKRSCVVYIDGNNCKSVAYDRTSLEDNWIHGFIQLPEVAVEKQTMNAAFRTGTGLITVEATGYLPVNGSLQAWGTAENPQYQILDSDGNEYDPPAGSVQVHFR